MQHVELFDASPFHQLNNSVQSFARLLYIVAVKRAGLQGPKDRRGLVTMVAHAPVTSSSQCGCPAAGRTRGSLRRSAHLGRRVVHAGRPQQAVRPRQQQQLGSSRRGVDPVTATAASAPPAESAQAADDSSVYDTVIVGGGVSGLCTALALSAEHGGERWGGKSRAPQPPWGRLSR